jgi:DNA-directed RNA polymerase specialized sigma24 family protein
MISLPGDVTDGELLERFAQSKDEAAFAALVERHGALVLGVCRRVLNHEHDAEDAFQATFLLLARKAGNVRWHESVGNWLFEAAYRIAAKARVQGGPARQARARTGCRGAGRPEPLPDPRRGGCGQWLPLQR